LLDNTLQTLDVESKKNQDKYLALLGNKLENVVAAHQIKQVES